MPLEFLGIAATKRGTEISTRSGGSFDLLADAIDIGQQVIPIVREGVARRDAALAVTNASSSPRARNGA